MEAGQRVTLPIEQLNPAKYNPREIDDDALDGLAAGIDEFGVVQDIVVNIRDGLNVIVGGHQRVSALGKLGRTDAPCVLVDLDELAEKRLNVLLNSRHVTGRFTADLAGLLEELKMDDEVLFEKLRFPNLEIDLDVFMPRDGELPELAAERDSFYTMTFILDEADKDAVVQALNAVREAPGEKKGVTLAKVARAFLRQQVS